MLASVNRSFSVRTRDASSSCDPLFCGVPQGSILVPLLITIYGQMGQIMHGDDTDFHYDEDDTIFFVSIKPSTTEASCIISCLTDIKLMSKNVLTLQIFSDTNCCYQAFNMYYKKQYDNPCCPFSCLFLRHWNGLTPAYICDLLTPWSLLEILWHPPLDHFLTHFHHMAFS